MECVFYRAALGHSLLGSIGGDVRRAERYFGRNTGEERKHGFGEEAELEAGGGKLSGGDAALAVSSATPWRELRVKPACGKTPPPASEDNDRRR